MKKYVKADIELENWSTEDAREFLIDIIGVSEEAVDLVEYINGRSIETYEDILFVRTGYRDFQQFQEDELDYE